MTRGSRHIGEYSSFSRCSSGQGGQDTWAKLTTPQDDPPGQEGQDTWRKRTAPQDTPPGQWGLGHMGKYASA